MQYPEDTTTTNKQGKREVRVLQEEGQYIKYGYLDPKTGKKTAKYSLILKCQKSQAISDHHQKHKMFLRSENKKEHLVIIPMKAGKSLIVGQKKEQRKLKILDEKKKKIVEF